MSLTTLPSEIVIAIIREIGHTEDLVSLVSCSRLFYEFGKPFLYSSFTKAGRTGAATFVRSLLEKPSLRQYVKEFSWSFSPYVHKDDPFSEVHTHMFTPKNRVHVLKIIADAALSREEENRLVQDLYRPKNSDAFTAFLLLLLPNLESLELPDACSLTYLQTFLARLPNLQHSPDSPMRHHFANLSSLSILNYDTCQRACVRDFMRLLDLKTIKDFTVYSPYEWEEDLEERKRIFSRSNSIQDLTLYGDTIGSQELKDFLRCFKDLRRLEYSDDLENVTCCTFDFQGEEVYEAILPVKSQLEILVLYTAPPSDRGWPAVVEHNVGGNSLRIGSLTDFEKLTHLDISSYLLLGPQFAGNAERPGVHYSEDNLRCVANLPSSLEYLIIRDCGEGIYDALERILSSTALVVSLSTVVVIFSSKDHIEEISEPLLSMQSKFLSKACHLFLLGKYQRVLDAETQNVIPGSF